MDEVRPEVVLAWPGWATLTLENTAKYLGFRVGPANEEPQWTEVGARILKRIASWGWGSLGLHLTTAVYNTYIASVAGFKLQLAEMDDRMLRT